MSIWDGWDGERWRTTSRCFARSILDQSKGSESLYRPSRGEEGRTGKRALVITGRGRLRFGGEREGRGGEGKGKEGRGGADRLVFIYFLLFEGEPMAEGDGSRSRFFLVRFVTLR